MSEKQNKRFRKQCERLAPENYNRAIKLFKKLKRKLWLRHNTPNIYKHADSKRHGSESLSSFKERRKTCNQRRRGRELMMKRTYIIMKTMQHVKAV